MVGLLFIHPTIDLNRYTYITGKAIEMNLRIRLLNKLPVAAIQLPLKTERIKHKIYKTKECARSEIFNYIEFYYNSKHRNGNNDGISPIEYYEKL